MNDYGWEYKGDKFRNITEAFGKNLCDSYKSPIELYTTDFCNKIIEERESAIVAEISEQIGLNIDKEELLKALAYDRDQYQKGYTDALRGISQFEWIPVSERLPDDREDTYWVCTDGGYQCQCRWTNVNPFWTNLKTDWHWCHFDIPQYEEVVAWEILPEAYKEGEE